PPPPMTSTFTSGPHLEEQQPTHVSDQHHDHRDQNGQHAARALLQVGGALVDAAREVEVGTRVGDQVALLSERLLLQGDRLVLRGQRLALQLVGFLEQLLDARALARLAHASTALWYTACASSRSSSTSSSFCMRCASSPESSTGFSARQVTSARSGFKLAWCSACCTASKAAGAVSTSIAPSSPAITSSAPPSRATSITRSSLAPGANTNCPQCLN